MWSVKFKLITIYIILWLRLDEHSFTISAPLKNNKNFSSILNASQDKEGKKQFNKQIFDDQNQIEETLASANERGNTTTYKSVSWQEKENLMNSEYTCLLHPIKLRLLWWSHSNGTLNTINLHFLNEEQKLDLSYRNITTYEKTLQLIPFNIIKNMKLVVFSLAYNNLTFVPFHILEMMANTLSYLSLKGNKFENVESRIAKKNSRYFRLYEYLKIKKPQDIPQAALQNDSHYLAWSQFPYMPSLLELDVSECEIKYIGKDSFKNLPNLKNLYLSHNKIKTIPSETFLYATSLEVLDLSFANGKGMLLRNNLAYNLELLYGLSIEEYTFKYVPNLKYLDLSYSKLEYVSALAFRHIGSNLKYLSLCYTAFPYFSKRIFNNSSSIVGLDLSGNVNIRFGVRADFFAGMWQSLTYLFFENSHLNDVDWLRPLINLRFLSLSNNNIRSLLPNNFRYLKNLQILDLSSNHISNWYFRVFKYNTNLHTLSLRDNNINIITPVMLEDYRQLKYLTLGKNNFVCDCLLRDLIDIAAINNQRSRCNDNIWDDLMKSINTNSVHLLQILQNSKLFTDSNLKNMVTNSLVASQSLYHLNGSVEQFQTMNNFKAKPNVRFIFNTLKTYKSKACLPQDYNEENTQIINNTLFIRNLQLLDYNNAEYFCYNETDAGSIVNIDCNRDMLLGNIKRKLNKLNTYIFGSLSGIILIVLTIILIYNKRRQILYFYYSLKSAALLSDVSKDARNNLYRLCDENCSKVYDIFVSYCQSDRDWVVQEFMPNIEQAADISICLHERDFEIGVTIIDNIVSCMERSKIIMLIISSNFLLSHWCQFEMQLAQYHILDLNKDNLMMVLLEDIPRPVRPKNLRFLMEMKTYIKWPGNNRKGEDVQPEEYKLFWRRLKSRLRITEVNAS